MKDWLIAALMGGAFGLLGTLAGGRMARHAALEAIREQSRSDREIQASQAAHERELQASQSAADRQLLIQQRREDAATRLLVAVADVRDMVSGSQEGPVASAAFQRLRFALLTDGVLVQDNDLTRRLQQVAMICFEWAGNTATSSKMTYAEFDHYCAYVVDSFDLWLRDETLPPFEPLPRPGLILFYDAVEHCFRLRDTRVQNE